MALLLKKTLDSGIDVEYHRIRRIEYNYDHGTQILEVASYTSEEKREAEKLYIETSAKQIKLQGEINALIEKEADAELVKEKIEELHSLNSEYVMNVASVEYIVFDSNELITDTKTLYKEIKKNEGFKNAKDI